MKSKKGVKSLNGCLYRGPLLLPDLCGILFRLQLHPIVLLADIEKAFLQMGIQEPDRNVTQFLWFDDVKNVKEPEYDACRFVVSPLGWFVALSYWLEQSSFIWNNLEPQFLISSYQWNYIIIMLIMWCWGLHQLRTPTVSMWSLKRFFRGQVWTWGNKCLILTRRWEVRKVCDKGFQDCVEL